MFANATLMSMWTKKGLLETMTTPPWLYPVTVHFQTTSC